MMMTGLVDSGSARGRQPEALRQKRAAGVVS